MAAIPSARRAGAISRKNSCSGSKDGLVTVLDVRPTDEYAAGHLPKAVNIRSGVYAKLCGR